MNVHDLPPVTDVQPLVKLTAVVFPATVTLALDVAEETYCSSRPALVVAVRFGIVRVNVALAVGLEVPADAGTTGAVVDAGLWPIVVQPASATAATTTLMLFMIRSLGRCDRRMPPTHR